MFPHERVHRLACEIRDCLRRSHADRVTDYTRRL